MTPASKYHPVFLVLPMRVHTARDSRTESTARSRRSCRPMRKARAVQSVPSGLASQRNMAQSTRTQRWPIARQQPSPWRETLECRPELWHPCRQTRSDSTDSETLPTRATKKLWGPSLSHGTTSTALRCAHVHRVSYVDFTLRGNAAKEDILRAKRGPRPRSSPKNRTPRLVVSWGTLRRQVQQEAGTGHPANGVHELICYVPHRYDVLS